jgi:hypothetical protein
VLVDDRGVDVGDLGTLGEAVDNEGIQVVLRATSSTLVELRARAVERQLGVIAFPAFAQRTNDYDQLRAQIAQTRTDELEYLGLALYGPKRTVRELTGSLGLLR